MNEFPFGFEQIHPTTWFYLSSLLIIGLYFKFGRAWSVRNFDLVLLILLGPGLLLQLHGYQVQQTAQRLAAAEAAANGAQGDPVVGLPGESVPGQPKKSKASSPRPAGVAGDSSGSASGDLNRKAQDSASPSPSPATPTTPAEGTVSTQGNDRAEGTTKGGDAADNESDDSAANGSAAKAGDAKPSAVQMQRGRFIEMLGFVWLFAVGGLLMVRMLLDPTMTRRPLLEPNLSTGGLIFIGCSLFIFFMANVIAGTPTADDLTGPEGAQKILALKAPQEHDDSLTQHGPGYPLIHVLPSLATGAIVAQNEDVPEQNREHVVQVLTAKAMAVLAHLAIVAGIVLIGYRHFDNIKMGIGAAALYLMLPYTAEMTGRVIHILPAALLVWAVLCYRRPLTAGLLLGLAMGVFYYPFFLLPLWLSFYWERGLMRFLAGVLLMLGLTVLSLVFTSNDLAGFWQQVQQVFGLWFAKLEGLQGVWGLGWDPVFRLPVLATFMVLSASFALWPAQKNLGTLMSCTAALMLATQFWHGFGGGLFMGWYLPLVLLTVFRPNLEDRVALTVLGEGWFPRRRRTDARSFEDKRKGRAA